MWNRSVAELEYRPAFARTLLNRTQIYGRSIERQTHRNKAALVYRYRMRRSNIDTAAVQWWSPERAL